MLPRVYKFLMLPRAGQYTGIKSMWRYFNCTGIDIKQMFLYWQTGIPWKYRHTMKYQYTYIDTCTLSHHSTFTMCRAIFVQKMYKRYCKSKTLSLFELISDSWCCLCCTLVTWDKLLICEGVHLCWPNTVTVIVSYTVIFYKIPYRL